jgi:hypothetical protein
MISHDWHTEARWQRSIIRDAVQEHGLIRNMTLRAEAALRVSVDVLRASAKLGARRRI